MPRVVSLLLAFSFLCGTAAILSACCTSFWLINTNHRYHTGLWRYCKKDICGPTEEDKMHLLPSKYVIMVIRACLMIAAGSQIVASYFQCARLVDSVWKALANPVIWSISISVLTMAVPLAILASRVISRRESADFGWSFYVGAGYAGLNVLSLLLLVTCDRRKRH